MAARAFEILRSNESICADQQLAGAQIAEETLTVLLKRVQLEFERFRLAATLPALLFSCFVLGRFGVGACFVVRSERSARVDTLSSAAVTETDNNVERACKRYEPGSVSQPHDLMASVATTCTCNAANFALIQAAVDTLIRPTRAEQQHKE